VVRNNPENKRAIPGGDFRVCERGKALDKKDGRAGTCWKAPKGKIDKGLRRWRRNSKFYSRTSSIRIVFIM
jgi:hypothetical protein